MQIYNLETKFNLFSRGTCFKNKQEIICHTKSGVTKIDKIFGFDPEKKVIPKNSFLIFVEDRQFYSDSREFNLPFGAWIRGKVIDPKGNIVWITLFYEQKKIWDFETYNGKKNLILKQLNDSYELVSLSVDKTKKYLIEG
jgi:hypothetical protein